MPKDKDAMMPVLPAVTTAQAAQPFAAPITNGVAYTIGAAATALQSVKAAKMALAAKQAK